MLLKQQRIEAFAKLGSFLGQYQEESKAPELEKLNRFFLDNYRTAIKEAELFNHWFSAENLHFALQEWSSALQEKNLHQWLDQYPEELLHPQEVKTVAIIMAGNIPLVGFHDLLSVLMSGHRALIKPSTDDSKLLPLILQVLVAIDADFAPYLKLADGTIKGFDAVIATGSDNSARYFEHYFKSYPRLVRKNRSSVAVLNGEENDEELALLGEDIFRYFGLGCRNVSKVYVPEDFKVQRLFEAFYPWSRVAENNKYANNYDYNRAIYLMEHHDFLDNGFFIIKEEQALHAPVAVLHLEKYTDANKLREHLNQHEDQLQCVVSNCNWLPERVSLGESQKPKLWDYADKVDSLQFLAKL
jgi:hypothetical protein